MEELQVIDSRALLLFDFEELSRVKMHTYYGLVVEAMYIVLHNGLV